MDKILIPTDFSENAARAVAYVTALYAEKPASFILVHIQNTDLTNENESDSIHDIKKITQNLERCKSKFTDKNHQVMSIFRTGSFIENIRNIVETQGINLIAMGTKGMNNSTKMPIGTNTQSVITKVQCPVMVVPNATEFSPIHEVVFPTDLYLRCSSKTMEPLIKILANNKSILHIVYRASEKTTLSKTQKLNKEYLQNFHSQIGVKLHKISTANLRDELENYISKHETQLITMSAKSLNFIQLLLSKSSSKADSYIRKTPFLFLREDF